MVLVVRTDLGMSAGKIAAQCVHGTYVPSIHRMAAVCERERLNLTLFALSLYC